ncbi:MAG: hypothetical protein J6P79_10285 [Pseudobutyrivibrio sp.]|nr:hypothetical protein [Pseudobutyrivibrio sp.]
MSDAEELLEISPKDKFVKEYKSVYQAMTAKHDCKSKIFPRNVVIEKADIIELNNRVCEKLVNYQDAGFTISVSVSLSGKDSYEFSTWQEFENHRWTEYNDIVSITVVWEFNAVLPQYDIPQKHVLVVKMTDGLRPEEMLNIVFAGKLENIEDIDKQMYPVVARVDFINSVLGNELLQIVEEWNKGLEISERALPKLFKFARKHKSKIAFIIEYTTRVVLVVSILRILVNSIIKLDYQSLGMMKIDDVSYIIRLCGILYISWMLLSRLARFLANMCYGILNSVLDYHIFNITRGDGRIQKELDSSKTHSYIRTVATILGTIVLNIVCNIISNIIIG